MTHNLFLVWNSNPLSNKNLYRVVLFKCVISESWIHMPTFLLMQEARFHEKRMHFRAGNRFNKTVTLWAHTFLFLFLRRDTLPGVMSLFFELKRISDADIWAFRRQFCDTLYFLKPYQTRSKQFTFCALQRLPFLIFLVDGPKTALTTEIITNYRFFWAHDPNNGNESTTLRSGKCNYYYTVFLGAIRHTILIITFNLHTS
jgi:hypothetical protein